MKEQKNLKEYSTLIWACCIVFSIIIVGGFVYTIYPYSYNAELDCEGDLGNLAVDYKQIYREEHPIEGRIENNKVIYVEDTNRTTINEIPLYLNINGVSGAKLHCKGKLSGTYSFHIMQNLLNKGSQNGRET